MSSGKRSRLPAAERRAQLMEVGRAVFAERGFDGASIEEIAERAQVSRPIVYGHFGDKNGLFTAIVEREMAYVTGRVSQAIAEGSAQERVERVMLSFLRYVQDRPDGFALLSRETPARAGVDGIIGLLGDLAEHIAAAMRPALEAGGFDPDAAPIYAHGLIGMATFTGTWWQQTPDPPPLETVARHLTALVWMGLQQLPREPALLTPTEEPRP